MGYIAYVAGTLIAVAFVHAIWNRTSQAISNQKLDSTQSANWQQPCDEVSATKVVNSSDVSRTIPVPTFELHEAQSLGNNAVESARKINDESKDDHGKQEKAAQHNANGSVNPGVRSVQLMPPPRAIATESTGTTTPKGNPNSNMPPPILSVPRNPPVTQSAAATARQGGLQKPVGFSNLIPPSAASSLRIPRQKVLTNTKMQPANTLSTSTQHPSSRPSRKIILSPGHSPLDWAALTKDTSPSAPEKLRGVNAMAKLGPFRMGRITHKRLKAQTGRKGKDAWTSYQGKVYNISAYLDFHPGGQDELMKGAGRSSDQLFAEVHPWVNWDGMLSGCLIGMLVNDDDPTALGNEPDNELDEMD